MDPNVIFFAAKISSGYGFAKVLPAQAQDC